MKKLAVVMTLAMAAGVASAGVVTINNLDVRSGGIYGHDANVGTPGAGQIGNVTYNGGNAAAITSNQIDVAMTYSGVDLDGDATANDAVTFTLRFTGATANQRTWGQGIDLGFGNLNGVTVTVTSVTGTTTDLGNPIVFDGFTGGMAGMGANGVFDRNVDINGTTVNMATTGGGFQFKTAEVNFAPTASIIFGNSGGTGGSIVARAYDLQFSAIPEPATLGLIAAFGGGIVFIRRRFMM